MFVSRSMTRKVITIDKEANVFEAQDKMAQNRIRHLPVVDPEGRLIGIVTDRDIRSALPYGLFVEPASEPVNAKLEKLKIEDIMTPEPKTIPPEYTVQDALMIIQELRVGALPVVDDKGKLKGILSVRDLLRAFINVLGIGEPGTLLCVLVDEKIGQLKTIVDTITEENISFGSVLVARYWDKDKRAVFPLPSDQQRYQGQKETYRKGLYPARSDGMVHGSIAPKRLIRKDGKLACINSQPQICTFITWKAALTRIGIRLTGNFWATGKKMAFPSCFFPNRPGHRSISCWTSTPG